MLGTLAAAAALALSPAQAGVLNLTNARTTYGEMGPVRTDNRYLPLDLYFLAFDIEGLMVGPDGKVGYTMTVAVNGKDPATGQFTKPIFAQDKPAESEEFLVLGGNRMAGRAWVKLNPDQAPGTYVCRVTVVDQGNKATKTLERSFDVVKKDFGLIGLMTTTDPKGELPAPTTGVQGQILYVHGAVLGFGRGPDKKPNTTIELRCLDESKRPTITKPQTVFVPKEMPEGNDLALITFVIPMNREGTFTAELKATDATTGKTSTMSFPIKVLPPAK
jgi:hypothetical protein